jgi:predicted nucleic acid-binding protein
MASVVVDTDVVSFLFKNHPLAYLYLPHLSTVTPIISFMTVAELDRWAFKANCGARRQAAMDRHLERFVVQPWDRVLCRLWAQVTSEAERLGRPVDVADGWHAATALYHQVPLVTHNRRHFESIPGLVVISEAPA